MLCVVGETGAGGGVRARPCAAVQAHQLAQVLPHHDRVSPQASTMKQSGKLAYYRKINIFFQPLLL